MEIIRDLRLVGSPQSCSCLLGLSPVGVMKWLLELPIWERWEQGQGADAMLWHVGVLTHGFGTTGMGGKHTDPAQWGTCQPGKKGQLQSQKKEEDCKEQE